MKNALSIILLAILPLMAWAEDCPLVKIAAERLPDLNIPRSAHSAFCVNGELTVVGGHTTDFVPTATAEYYKDGEWHLVKTAYPHDNGICVGLSSGKVLLAGGHEKPLGIGQTFPVEEYDPKTHTFRGFSCLDTKRTLATGIEIDGGRVVVAGNWYAGDSIEVFDSDRRFHFVKEVSVERASPYILRIARDDVLILGNGGIHGETLQSDVVDRLKGDALHVPLLRQWQPLFYFAPFSGETGFIGDMTSEDYSWLLPVQDVSAGDSTMLNRPRQLAFLLVRDTTFTLLPTVCSVPIKSPFGDIFYYSPVLADRHNHRGYVHGIDKNNRHYVLCVEYDKRPAPLTLYYTDPLPEAGWPQIQLSDDGDLIITGGINYNNLLGGTLDNDNFSPLSSVYRLHIGTKGKAEQTVSSHLWLWLSLLLAFAILVGAFLWRRLKAKPQTIPPVKNETEEIDKMDTKPDTSSDQLMQRICELMEDEKPYLSIDLKLTDVAAMLGTNRNVISSCINNQLKCSFSLFINSYRIKHAQELMHSQPDAKITEVWMASGFSSESSFFRAFKTITKLTPNEWKQLEDSTQKDKQ